MKKKLKGKKKKKNAAIGIRSEEIVLSKIAHGSSNNNIYNKVGWMAWVGKSIENLTVVTLTLRSIFSKRYL